jgi:hypothetical protein
MGPYCREYKTTVCFSFFPLTAQLPNQDVFGINQTHLGAAQTQKLGPDHMQECQKWSRRQKYAS